MSKQELNISERKKVQCRAIIHSAAAMAGSAAAGIAQVPLADTAIITPIQITMVISLGNVFGQKLSRATAQGIISSLGGALIGRSISQIVVGWIPGIGNVVNTSTAAVITETIGWKAVDKFAKDQADENHSEDAMPEEDDKDVSSEQLSRVEDLIEKFLSEQLRPEDSPEDYDEVHEYIRTQLRNNPIETDEYQKYKAYQDRLYELYI